MSASPSPPYVSVVMAAFNEEVTIQRAIQSVLDQSFRDFELLIIDDGSSDTTWTQIKNFPDKRIHPISLKSNSGKSHALNVALRKAKGEYIAFIDADDKWHTGKIEKQLGSLLSSSTTFVASVVGQRVMLLDDGTSHVNIPTSSKDWVKTLLQGCSLGAGSTLMVKREVIDKVGLFDEKLRRCIDHDWVLRFAQKGGQFIIEDDILVDIFTLRGKQSFAATQAVQQFSKKHRPLYQQYEPEVYKRAQWELWKHVADRSRREGRLWGACKAYAYTFLSDPHRGLKVVWRKYFLEKLLS